MTRFTLVFLALSFASAPVFANGVFPDLPVLTFPGDNGSVSTQGTPVIATDKAAQ